MTKDLNTGSWPFSQSQSCSQPLLCHLCLGSRSVGASPGRSSASWYLLIPAPAGQYAVGVGDGLADHCWPRVGSETGRGSRSPERPSHRGRPHEARGRAVFLSRCLFHKAAAQGVSPAAQAVPEGPDGGIPGTDNLTLYHRPLRSLAS